MKTGIGVAIQAYPSGFARLKCALPDQLPGKKNMKNLLDRLLAVACLGLVSISVPAYASTYTFSQTGFRMAGWSPAISPAAI